MPWIVMTSSAKMPQSVRHAYRNVALVHITDEYADKNMVPRMISERARGVCPGLNGKSVIHRGKHHVGMGTKKSAIYLAIKDAEAYADRLNAQEERIAS
jgi:predicted Zn-dependent protease with MMP-like domain